MSDIFFRRQRAFVFPVILVVITIIFFTLLGILFLAHGEIAQLARTDEITRADAICRAGLEDVLSIINERPWAERPFRYEPLLETDVSFGGGSYSYFVTDTPDSEFHADVFVQAKFGRVSRAMFWRLACEINIFDELNTVRPIFSFSLPANRLPKDRKEASRLSMDMSELLKLRTTNMPLRNRQVRKLEKVSTLVDILNILELPVDTGLRDTFSGFATNSHVVDPRFVFEERVSISEELARALMNGGSMSDSIPGDRIVAGINENKQGACGMSSADSLSLEESLAIAMAEVNTFGQELPGYSYSSSSSSTGTGERSSTEGESSMSAGTVPLNNPVPENAPEAAEVSSRQTGTGPETNTSTNAFPPPSPGTPPQSLEEFAAQNGLQFIYPTDPDYNPSYIESAGQKRDQCLALAQAARTEAERNFWNEMARKWEEGRQRNLAQRRFNNPIANFIRNTFRRLFGR